MLLIVVLLLALLAIVFRQPLATHAKVLLLLSQELPQMPVKPLHLVTAEPVHEQLQLNSRHGPIVADLFLPTPQLGRAEPRTRPGLILAMGVRTPEKDRPALLGLAETMARLGFVVLWPRLQLLDQGVSTAEEPETFVAAVHYLESVDLVASERISLLGFSVGASIALVAAADPSVADRVHAVVFFGGYYDMIDYLVSLATGAFVLDGQMIAWQPHEEAIGHTRLVLEAKRGEHILKIFETTTREAAEALLRSAPAPELAELRRMNPSEHLDTVVARLYILHDRGDPYVPYVESVKLRRELHPAQVGAFLLTGLFAHAQFKRDLSWEALRDVLDLYGFVYTVLNDL